MESAREPALPQAFLLSDKPMWNLTATSPDAGALSRAVLHRLHGAGRAAIARQVAREFGIPLACAAGAVLPLAGWLGWRYLAGFADRASVETALMAPMVGASAATLAVTCIASWRHLRQAWALQPVEALQ